MGFVIYRYTFRLIDAYGEPRNIRMFGSKTDEQVRKLALEYAQKYDAVELIQESVGTDLDVFATRTIALWACGERII